MKLSLPKVNIDLRQYSSPDPATARQIIVLSLFVVALMAAAAASSFFLALKGAERTMVPDIRGKELSTALLELQEKELYPRLQLRNSNNPGDRGTILEQNPRPGAIVKAGRRITLVVSRGSVVSKVDNFVGQNLGEVKLHLQSLVSATTQAILSVKEPPIYVFDQRAAGTILQQKPLPGTAVTGPTKLEFVVSRGPEAPYATVPALAGLGMEAALKALEGSGLVADFSVRPAEGSEKPATVVSQVPAAGASLPQASRIALTLAAPASGGDKVFGLLQESLPEYPYPLKLSVDAVLPSGDRQTLFTVNHPGGSFTFPYYLPSGSRVILSILGQEKVSKDVKKGE